MNNLRYALLAIGLVSTHSISLQADALSAMQQSIDRMHALHAEILKEFEEMEKNFEREYEAFITKSDKAPGWRIAFDDRRHIDTISITIFNINTHNVDSAYGNDTLFITTDRERIKVTVTDTQCSVAIRQRRRHENIESRNDATDELQEDTTADEHGEDAEQIIISRIVSQSRPLSCGVDLSQATLTYKRSLNQLIISMPKNEKPCTQQITVDMID